MVNQSITSRLKEKLLVNNGHKIIITTTNRQT
jgi:hypothetical protein